MSIYGNNPFPTGALSMNNETSESQPSSAEEFAFEEMAKLIQEKESAGVEFQVFIRQLEEEEAKAVRRVEVARAMANICATTKTRKPRKDKGVRRKPKPQTTPSKGDST